MAGLMRAVVQRVSEASVTVEQKIVGQIESGLVVLLGVAREDSEIDARYLAEKIANLRIFDDSESEKSLLEINGSALVISQFTLLGDCRKGRRPSWSAAASPDEARRLYEFFVAQLSSFGVPTQTGRFQTQMAVNLINQGPVTMLLDSRKAF
jgi:D-aminoacyl-tRNA deacylase